LAVPVVIAARRLALAHVLFSAFEPVSALVSRAIEKTMTHAWSPSSWKKKPIRQNVTYPDPRLLREVLGQLAKLPPLVTSWEVENLKSQLAEAAQGRRFLLQGGDCCESFDNCRSELIANKLKILLKMSVILTYGSHRSVIRVGRFAGQYAKPRSANTETRDGVTLPSFRGNLINHREFTPEARRPTRSCYCGVMSVRR
jgi:3-deoxy-7-phosphoheptulonate synthase